MRRPRNLSQVTDRRGRLDVAAYRIAERLMERMERERGIAGLREHLLPVVESAIVDTLPGGNLLDQIPEELRAIFHVCMQNSGRLL